MYDTIIISGGASKGIAALGSLQALIDRKLIDNVKKYIGTSVGAIIAYLLCIGYSPIELIICLRKSVIFDELNMFNLGNIMTGDGVTKWSIINIFVEKLTLDKTGFLLTLNDIYEKYGKELVCCTYNQTLRKKEYISYKNNPNLPCLIALRMSSNLPFIFDRFKYMNNYYIDGGIVDNFPLDLLNKEEKTFAIHLKNKKILKDQEFKILEYIYDIMCIPLEESDKNKIKNIDDNCTILKLDIENLDIFRFNISNRQQLDLFSFGYQECKNII